MTSIRRTCGAAYSGRGPLSAGPVDLKGRLQAKLPAPHGLADNLWYFRGTTLVMVERKRVPELVIRDAQRLESMVFSSYDSYFEGMNRRDCEGLTDWLWFSSTRVSGGTAGCR